MASVPTPAHAISDLPFLFCVWDGSDVANDLVPWNDGKAVAEQPEPDGLVGMTYAASKDLHQNLYCMS